MTTAIRVDTSRALRIRGWMSPGELEWLASIATGCKSIAEIGSFAGRSARAIADSMPSNALLYCIDPLDPTRPGNGLIRVPPGTGGEVHTRADGDEIHDELCRNMQDLILSGAVQFLRVSSLEAAEMMEENIGPGALDFVFLDGDHAQESVRADIDAWAGMVQAGGILAGHDYYAPGGPHQGVRLAVDDCFGAVDHPAGSIWSVRL